MGRPKLTARKHGGVDFKKIKKKIGRRLPPPKNTTKTEIKSKAIVLPEQSLVADRTGLAQSSGLTLKELLQLTSHTNVKSRIRALTCIRELLLKNQPELKLHKLAIIEKLRERITDDDKKVCETLYELLESVIFPGIKEETPGPFTSLIMAYIFNAMTHLSIHIRLMAFEFFDLVVQHYPSSILSHAEKVLQNYEDILRKNHIYLEDKGQLKSGLLGLVHYLSMLPHDKKVHSSSFCKVKEKKKAGRRLPSPKNATNTEVKSEVYLSSAGNFASIGIRAKGGTENAANPTRRRRASANQRDDSEESSQEEEFEGNHNDSSDGFDARDFRKERNVTNYTEDFFSLSTRADLNESMDQKVGRYLKGLKLSIQHDLTFKEIDTIDEAIRYAFKSEELQTKRNALRLCSHLSGLRYSSGISKPNAIADTVKASTTTSTSTTVGRAPVRTSAISHGNDFTCYRCGEVGHKSNVCPKRRQVNFADGGEESEEGEPKYDHSEDAMQYQPMKECQV
ncbi:hypothetical protein GIB67_032940 [Kingdonia uniflora]|uniref:CCHC-type domain-containing protein n=1 Tax=Kingdonia uniflora TaxID=39325 RepID=A0A7J7MYA7_9MAGN|nr:hypothetical protein GIB67_032940 [Kingdonia uniflora]